MELKDIDGSRFLYDPTKNDIDTILCRNIPEFTLYKGKIPLKKVSQYICLMYDPSSPLWRTVLDYYVRKTTCAEMVGFPKKKSQWAEEAEAILLGTDTTVNDMVVGFIAQFGLIELYQTVAYLGLLSSETKRAISLDGDKNSIDIIGKAGDRIKDLQRIIFHSGEYDEITAARKALYSRLEKERLKIRPEDVVRTLSENGSLPADFSPYGEDYEVEKSKFLGDEEPNDL